MNNKILVLGTIAYDGIETPLGSRDKILGGCATYIGLSASLFSNDCGIVSIIGSDFKREHLEIIKDVSKSFIIVSINCYLCTNSSIYNGQVS